MKSTAWSQLASVLFVLACGCTPRAEEPQRTPPAAAASITDRDWELVALGERENPRGSESRPVTLRLETATSRAVGFAGCNQYSASYALTADSLHFEPAISTKMACADGMELETTFLATLPVITTYEATDSTLTLHAPDGPLARFRAP